MRLERAVGVVTIAVALATLPEIASLAQVLALLLAVAPIAAGMAHRGAGHPGLAQRAHPTR